MKLTSFNLRIFVDECERLKEDIDALHKVADGWLWYQDDRKSFGNTDQNAAGYARQALEEQLMKIRERLAVVYDFQGDRGLHNFVPDEFVVAMREEGGFDI